MVTEYQTCFACGFETGRAGAGDDSIYSDDGRGPWCLGCYSVVNPDGVPGDDLGDNEGVGRGVAGHCGTPSWEVTDGD